MEELEEILRSKIRRLENVINTHTMIVAEDDPHLATFRGMHEQGLVELRVLPAVGCEAVARHTFNHAAAFIRSATNERAWLESVEVKEHGGNSAIYEAFSGGIAPGI